jgi:hypothetical protein
VSGVFDIFVSVKENNMSEFTQASRLWTGGLGCMNNTKQVYEPGLWKSYSTEDKVAFLIECGCKQTAAEDYSYRDFASLPHKIREKIEALENFEEAL